MALAFGACGSGSSASEAPDAGESQSHALPEVQPSTDPPPKKLVVNDLKVGTGAEAKGSGQILTVQYTGSAYRTGKQFDARPRSEPFTFQLGKGYEQEGWEQGVPGMRGGGVRELIIPPDLTLNELGRPETLVYLIELLSIER